MPTVLYQNCNILKNSQVVVPLLCYIMTQQCSLITLIFSWIDRCQCIFNRNNSQLNTFLMMYFRQLHIELHWSAYTFACANSIQNAIEILIECCCVTLLIDEGMFSVSVFPAAATATATAATASWRTTQTNCKTQSQMEICK